MIHLIEIFLHFFIDIYFRNVLKPIIVNKVFEMTSVKNRSKDVRLLF